MPNLRPIEILLIVLLVLLLFGARRLPDLARSIGKSLKIFKSEVKDLRDDDHPAPTESTETTPAALPDTARPDTARHEAALADAQHAATTPPHGDPARDALPTDTADRKQV